MYHRCNVIASSLQRIKNVQRKEMSMKLDLGKIFFLILFLTLSVMAATAGTVKGTITDRQTKEPLTGATVQVSGTAQGAVADLMVTIHWS